MIAGSDAAVDHYLEILSSSVPGYKQCKSKFENLGKAGIFKPTSRISKIQKASIWTSTMKISWENVIEAHYHSWHWLNSSVQKKYDIAI